MISWDSRWHRYQQKWVRVGPFEDNLNLNRVFFSSLSTFSNVLLSPSDTTKKAPFFYLPRIPGQTSTASLAHSDASFPASPPSRPTWPNMAPTTVGGVNPSYILRQGFSIEKKHHNFRGVFLTPNQHTSAEKKKIPGTGNWTKNPPLQKIGCWPQKENDVLPITIFPWRTVNFDTVLKVDGDRHFQKLT